MGSSQSKLRTVDYQHQRSSITFSPSVKGHKTECEGDAPPPPPSDGAQPPPPPPLPDDGNDGISQAARSASAFKTPGPYEMVAQESKRLTTLDTFDGFRCDVSKQLSPYMVAIHNFWLGTNMMQDGRKSTYAFVSQVADENGLLMARVDPGRGSVDGRIHSALLGGLAMGKLQLGMSVEGQQDQALAEIDFGGDTWTGNLKYGSMGGGIAYGCNYFQTITPRLAMGGEGMYLGVNGTLMSNYSMRYVMPAKTGEEELSSSAVADTAAKATDGGVPAENAGSSTLWASLNSMSGQATLSYKRVVTPNRVTLGACLDFSPFSLESQVLVGAEFKLSRSKINYCIDGSGRIQSTLETKLGMGQGAPSLSFSSDIDNLKDDRKFGFGLNFEG